MVYKLLVSSLLVITFSCVYADWLDDLSSMIGEAKEWKVKEAEALIEKYVKQDEETIQKIEDKIKSAGNGFWATLHYGAYKVELLNARSEKRYHEKLLKAFKELPENKKEREKLVHNLITLYTYQKELDLLKKEWDTEHGIAAKAKVAALITAKQAQISTKRSLLKSSFLIS